MEWELTREGILYMSPESVVAFGWGREQDVDAPVLAASGRCLSVGVRIRHGGEQDAAVLRYSALHLWDEGIRRRSRGLVLKKDRGSR